MLERIAKEVKASKNQIEKVIELFESGATIPFVARYRKEATGNLDEVVLFEIQQEWKKFLEISKRKKAILSEIESQGKLTSDLSSRIHECWSSIELEDIYLPFKRKRKTKAEKARENGLEGFAKMLMKQELTDLDQIANRFIKGEVNSKEEALEGAGHIIAEWISEREWVRKKVRWSFEKSALISSKVIKGKEEEGSKYKDYFEWEEPLKKCPSHRYLAISRAENEKVVRVSVGPNEIEVLTQLERGVLKGNAVLDGFLKRVIKDAYKRLLKPAIESEYRKITKSKADRAAIVMFSENLRQLLLTAPIGQRRTLAIDPGFRTGCKVVCLNELGNIEHNETIYPHPPQKDMKLAANKIRQLINAYKIGVIAVGNGTAGRETEQWLQRMKFDTDIEVYVVSESGASIYSASKIAREEFPQYDVTVRGAISIGRRLMDPLAELVKLEAKSIGVGQYQHDVDQAVLKENLDSVVEFVVNKVGVELNTSSSYLLAYIAGIGPVTAKKIVDFRTKNGAFKNRNELLRVPGVGAKAFEQCAGFLRINNGENALDNSAVHPESYSIVKRMAKDLNVEITELLSNPKLVDEIQKKSYLSGRVGEYTLNDILEELKKPGRDPRKKSKRFEFDPSIQSIKNVKEGMKLPGIVTNLTSFGAFVDIGIKQNGLLHISQITDAFIKSPSEVLQLNQHLLVLVTEVDIDRERIQLSLKFK